MEELSLIDYLAILKRRKMAFLLVTGILFILSLIFTFNWSNYRSIGTVEIAQSEIDTSALETKEGASIADLQISRVQQKVLSTSSLIEVIKKFNLYSSAQKNVPLAEIAEKMSQKIRITLVGSTLANPASAQKATAGQLSAIAFKLSFDYDNPLLAQQVANELINRFLDEDIKDRRNQARETSSFLKEQTELLETSLVEQEEKIADFRTVYGDTRPESLAFNQQASAATLMSLQNTQNQITANLGTQGTLRAQLASTSPYARTMADGQILTTPDIQLKALQSEYATLTAKYGPTHPDVIKTKRQIESLEPLVASTKPNTAILKAKIDDAKARLVTTEKTNGPSHPDVLNLKNQLDQYKNRLAQQQETEEKSFIQEDADNPAYIQLITQLRAVQEQYESLLMQRKTLEKEQQKYHLAVADNPVAEQQFSALSRDYENTKVRYKELKDKKLQADMTQTIEQNRNGQRFILANPPELPLGTQPRKMIFFLAGLFLSFAGGLLSVFMLQFLSHSMIGPRHVASLIGVEPLVCMPRILTNNNLKGIKKMLFLLRSFIRCRGDLKNG